MAHSSQSLLSAFASPRRLVLFATLAAAAIPSTADARVGAYDGVWNVTFATTRGNCSSGYSVPFSVAGSRVANRWLTASLVAQLLPQSKVTICFRKIPNWVQSGSFRPSC